MKYLIIILLFLTSCSTYNRLAKKPPLTDKDTLILAKRCLETFPVVPKIIVVEKTDTMVDHQAVTDLNSKLSTALKVLSECRDEKGNLINLDSLRKSITLKVQQQYKPATVVKTITKEITIPDTVQTVYWRKTAEQLTRESTIKDGKIQQLKDDLQRHKQRANKFLWWLIGAGGIAVLYIFGRLKFGIP